MTLYALNDDIGQLKSKHFAFTLKIDMIKKKTTGFLKTDAKNEKLTLIKYFNITNTTLDAMILELTQRFAQH